MHLPAPPFGLRKGPPGRYVGLVKCFTSSLANYTAKLAGARSVLCSVRCGGANEARGRCR